MMETLASWAPRALSVLRIMTGLLIIQHGMGKIIGFPAFPAYANVQPMSLIGAAGFIELIGGALLIVGLWTQPAAFIVSGEMAVAYFMVHAPKSFFPLINGGTLAIIYCFACLYLSTTGAGPLRSYTAWPSKTPVPQMRADFSFSAMSRCTSSAICATVLPAGIVRSTFASAAPAG